MKLDDIYGTFKATIEQQEKQVTKEMNCNYISFKQGVSQRTPNFENKSEMVVDIKQWYVYKKKSMNLIQKSQNYSYKLY